MTLDLAAYAPLLKQLYPRDRINNLVYKKNPLFGLMPKMTSFTGLASKEPLIYANSQNTSNSFSSANSYTTNLQSIAFLLTRATSYSFASLSNENMRASATDEGAFIPALETMVESALMSLTRKQAIQMYRSGTGSVARISSTATLNSSTVQVQLANPNDITNLENGMSLAFSTTDGGAAESGTAFIVQINRQQGSFLCSATFGGSPTALTTLVPTIAVSDYIYGSVGDINLAISGLDAWLPGGNVTSTPFFGVNRQVDATRLAGVDYTAGSGQAIDEALIDGITLINREGGDPDYLFMNPVDSANLAKALGSKQQYFQNTMVMVDDPKATVGYKNFSIIGTRSDVKVIADQNCPSGKAYALQMNTWEYKSLGEAVSIFDGDTLNLVRDPSSDGLLLRTLGYTQVSCRAPGYNGVITLPQ